MAEKRIGAVFPGQGSQYVGMGKDFYQNYEYVREIFDTGSKICGFDIAKICFEGPMEKLTDTEICQICVFAVSFSAWKVFQQHYCFVPCFVAGHSLGEYTAFTVAEAFSLKDAFFIIYQRAKFMKQAAMKNPGTMVAVLGKSVDEVEKMLEEFDDVYISNINGQAQIVVGGSIQGMNQFVIWCRENGVKIIPLNVSGAFHTPLMKDARCLLENEIDKLDISDCKIPVYTNWDGKITYHAEQIKNALKKQIVCSVQWLKIVESINNSVDMIIEFGPKKVLSGLVKKILPEMVVSNVEDIDSLNKTIEVMKLLT